MGMQVRIGTSGWNYKHWREVFYPPGLPQRRWFEHYSRHFDTVEINNTFYKQASPATYDRWREQAPPGFLYAVKAHRFLTQMRKLREPADPLERVIAGARRLKKHLGPLLYQLPPNFRPDHERLEAFFKLLPKGMVHVMEYRHADWLSDETFKLMRKHKVCLCIHDQLAEHPRVVTGKAVYLRFDGAGQPEGNYPKKHLRSWARWLEKEPARQVLIYFNNDPGGHAVRNALSLMEMLGVAV